LSVTCDRCGEPLRVGAWPFCPHGVYTVSVIDDQLEGGPRVFEHLGHDGVYIESKSQLKRELDARGLQIRYAHTADYYAKQQKAHDERMRDTGTLQQQQPKPNYRGI
jgi:hypothetical protein